MYAKLLAATLALTVTACATPAENEAQVAPVEAAVAIPADQKAFLNTCKAWDEWDKPAPPFKVFGNTYHVGTCGISAILITGDKGHVLIDSGTRKGAEVVAGNIKQLGFKLSDVEIMLHSHEHFDHVGGFAWMQGQTGAEIMASLPATEVLKSGVVAANDPQHDTHEPMAPVTVGGPIWGGTEIGLGDIKIRAIE
ncbi:MAG: MBL fold metallo-hydrolase, partial [Marinomonas sp.]